MSYDSKDPYDAAAWWHMQLCCDKCGTMLDLNLSSRDATDSDDYWHEYGQRAKEIGWLITNKEQKEAEWIILCPNCISKNHSN